MRFAPPISPIKLKCPKKWAERMVRLVRRPLPLKNWTRLSIQRSVLKHSRTTTRTTTTTTTNDSSAPSKGWVISIGYRLVDDYNSFPLGSPLLTKGIEGFLQSLFCYQIFYSPTHNKYSKKMVDFRGSMLTGNQLVNNFMILYTAALNTIPQSLV